MSQILCWVCPSCGAYVSVGIQFCPRCGHYSPTTNPAVSHAHVIPHEGEEVHSIAFRVQGHETEPYVTVFQKVGNGITGKCSCPAGVKGREGLCCRHRTRILRGNTEGIVSGNLEDVKVVQGWIAGSDIEVSVLNLAKGEAALERARKKIAAAKRELAIVMTK
jgi:hypothetical protein